MLFHARAVHLKGIYISTGQLLWWETIMTFLLASVHSLLPTFEPAADALALVGGQQGAKVVCRPSRPLSDRRRCMFVIQQLQDRICIGVVHMSIETVPHDSMERQDSLCMAAIFAK